MQSLSRNQSDLNSRSNTIDPVDISDFPRESGQRAKSKGGKGAGQGVLCFLNTREQTKSPLAFVPESHFFPGRLWFVQRRGARRLGVLGRIPVIYFPYIMHEATTEAALESRRS